LISERSADAGDRAVPGHWRRLLIWLERTAIGSVVERTTRFAMQVHLPCDKGHLRQHTIRNGLGFPGYGAITM
jgi:IS30 family transposase